VRTRLFKASYLVIPRDPRNHSITTNAKTYETKSKVCNVLKVSAAYIFVNIYQMIELASSVVIQNIGLVYA